MVCLEDDVSGALALWPPSPGHKHKMRCARQGLAPHRTILTPASSTAPSTTPSEASAPVRSHSVLVGRPQFGSRPNLCKAAGAGAKAGLARGRERSAAFASKPPQLEAEHGLTPSPGRVQKMRKVGRPRARGGEAVERRGGGREGRREEEEAAAGGQEDSTTESDDPGEPPAAAPGVASVDPPPTAHPPGTPEQPATLSKEQEEEKTEEEEEAVLESDEAKESESGQAEVRVHPALHVLHVLPVCPVPATPAGGQQGEVLPDGAGRAGGGEGAGGGQGPLHQPHLPV